MSQVTKFCVGRGGTASHIPRPRPIYTHRNAVLYSLPAKWGGLGGDNLYGCAYKARNLSLLRTWDPAVHPAAVLITGWVTVSYVTIPNVIKAWDSSVGVATRYGLDGPGIESRWGRNFPHPSRPALRPTQTPIHWILSLSPVKAAGAWLWPPTPSSAEVKETVELHSYLYCPSGPPWPILGWNLPLHFTECYFGALRPWRVCT